MNKLIEYLRTIFKVKRNFAEQVNATAHVEKYNRVLSDLEEVELMIAEGQLQKAEEKLDEIRAVH